MKEEKRRYSPQRAIELLNIIFGQCNSLNWWCAFIFSLNIFLLILILNLKTWLIVSRTRISGFKGWVCFTSFPTTQTQINKIYLKRLSKEVHLTNLTFFFILTVFSLQSFALTFMAESYHWHNKKQDEIIFNLLNCKRRLFSNDFNTAFLVLFRLDKLIVYIYQKGFQEI